MELSFTDLKKREVVNIVDGKCYGNIIDLTLSFPKGVLTGITVPGAKRNFITKCFDNNKLYIEESKILKIGNDVILVDLHCGDTCAPSIKLGKQKPPHGQPVPPFDKPPSPSPPICPPNAGFFNEDDEEY